MQRAIAAHELDKDPDVVKQKQDNQALRQSMMEEQKKHMNEMKKEMDSVYDEEFKARFEAAVKALPKPEISPNNFIGFDSFKEIQSLVMPFVHEVLTKKNVDTKVLRRQYLKSQQE